MVKNELTCVMSIKYMFFYMVSHFWTSKSHVLLHEPHVLNMQLIVKTLNEYI